MINKENFKLSIIIPCYNEKNTIKKLIEKNNKMRKKIARNGYKKAHKIFNNKIIAEFMVKKTLGEKITNKQVWHDG